MPSPLALLLLSSALVAAPLLAQNPPAPAAPPAKGAAPAQPAAPGKAPAPGAPAAAQKPPATPAPSPAMAEDPAAATLADAVMNAHGLTAWRNVRRVRFTFAVEAADKPGVSVFEAKHDWLVREGKDTVTWKGKTATIDVMKPNELTTDDAKEAMKRWTNDTYWLTAPFKLRDEGTVIAMGGSKSVDGQDYRTLLLSFKEVGQTPGDRYTVYVDPKTSLVMRWDYSPTADKTIPVVFMDYKDIGGMKFAMRHSFTDKIIMFKDVSFEP